VNAVGAKPTETSIGTAAAGPQPGFAVPVRRQQAGSPSNDGVNPVQRSGADSRPDIVAILRARAARAGAGLPWPPGTERLSPERGVLRRMRITGAAWLKGVPEELHDRYFALVNPAGSTQDEVTGLPVRVYRTSTNDLSIEELIELRDIFAQANAVFVPAKDREAIDAEITKRQTPGWAEEQQRIAEERKSVQSGREQRLLDQGRSKLGGQGETWKERSAQIEAWFATMKRMEADETWATVFAANRMSARQIGVKATNMGGTFTVRNKFAPQDKQRDREVNLDRGLSGIGARGVPENFYDPESKERNKNVLGLHALSASLLVKDNKKPIFSQLKPYKDSVVVFMPVPTEDDMQIFHAVARLKDPDLERYREMKSRFTRIKLAQGSDMHTTLFDVSETSEGPAKIRYGVTGRTQRAKDEEEVAADETDLAARKSNALEHSSILGPGAMQKINEIVMAYRQSESKEFPLYARWDPDQRHFRVITTTMEATNRYITNAGELRED
jgi:hypothetical protein